MSSPRTPRLLRSIIHCQRCCCRSHSLWLRISGQHQDFRNLNFSNQNTKLRVQSQKIKKKKNYFRLALEKLESILIGHSIIKSKLKTDYLKDLTILILFFLVFHRWRLWFHQFFWQHLMPPISNCWSPPSALPCGHSDFADWIDMKDIMQLIAPSHLTHNHLP